MAFEIQVHKGVDPCDRHARVRVLETDVDDTRFAEAHDPEGPPKSSCCFGQKSLARTVQVLVNDRRSQELDHPFDKQSAIENLDFSSNLIPFVEYRPCTTRGGHVYIFPSDLQQDLGAGLVHGSLHEGADGNGAQSGTENDQDLGFFV